MEPILSIRNLSKIYQKQTRALDGITVNVYPGEFVAVIGPSGAGKSSFIRCINRLITPSEGEILFDGVHIEQLNKKQLREVRSNIGMIFQQSNLIGRTSVLKNVLHGSLYHMPIHRSLLGLFAYEDKLKAVALLKKAGLEKQMYKRADALSMGQKQRVGICRALLQQPKLILADEPIASIDPKASRQVMDQLAGISKEQSITCIVNLHQVDVAKKYATRIIGMKDGRIVFDGTKDALTDEIIHHIYQGQDEEMGGEKSTSKGAVVKNEARGGHADDC